MGGMSNSGSNGGGMDLSSAPGVKYLSPSEQRLCSELHLLPGHYLTVKVGSREPERKYLLVCAALRRIS